MQWNCCLPLVTSYQLLSLVGSAISLTVTNSVLPCWQDVSKMTHPTHTRVTRTPTDSIVPLNFRVPVIRGKFIVLIYSRIHHLKSTGVLTLRFSPSVQLSSPRVIQTSLIWLISRPSLRFNPALAEILVLCGFK